MYELLHIYQRSGQDDQRFLHKVIALVLPDARLDSAADRFGRVCEARGVGSTGAPKPSN